MTTVMTQKSPRERTVRSAALLFRERGVGGTGLRDVVEHAGAPRGSLQYYFPGGKEQLLVEAMAWMAERAARPLHAALAAAEPPSPREVVHGLLDRFRELLTITDFRGGCPIVAGVADASWDSPAVTDGARAAFATWLAPLQEVLVRGGVPAERAARLALLVVSAAEGALVLSRARRDSHARSMRCKRSWTCCSRSRFPAVTEPVRDVAPTAPIDRGWVDWAVGPPAGRHPPQRRHPPPAAADPGRPRRRRLPQGRVDPPDRQPQAPPGPFAVPLRHLQRRHRARAARSSRRPAARPRSARPTSPGCSGCRSWRWSPARRAPTSSP